ncbi:MAG TPA: 6-carboxytetrahydropterin synthase [Thermoanaerobaculaceae bacterium]|nr:6-carboxytetrahydropterin synthase [Thermoanaerobaculaceae bacterium]
MILTVNRRFRFCASRRLARDGWSRDENERVYGAGSEGPWGSGENYQAHVAFAGDVDPRTGLLVNLAEVKAAIDPIIEARYDHRFLNLDTPPFDAVPPTAESLAARLLEEAAQACRGLPARPVACHLAESATTGATAYASGGVERELWSAFSAARRTWSPHLSEEENRRLFGRAASPLGHGHGYALRVVLGGPPDGSTCSVVDHARAAAALESFHEIVDHRNLNEEVGELAGSPMTTETLARFAFRTLSRELPVARVRLHETPDFFAEYDGERFSLGLERGFSAAHRLWSPHLSEAENLRVYGRCANPGGHGHRYAAQATVSAPLDERAGTVCDLGHLDTALRSALAPWHQRHLDREVDDFRSTPSTGENLVSALWTRLATALDGKLTRLRLVETENNRFTGRAEPRP